MTSESELGQDACLPAAEIPWDEIVVVARYVVGLPSQYFGALQEARRVLGWVQANRYPDRSPSSPDLAEYSPGTHVARKEGPLLTGVIATPTLADRDRCLRELGNADLPAVLVQWGYWRSWEYCRDLRLPDRSTGAPV